jgi:hypothetical protein
MLRVFQDSLPHRLTTALKFLFAQAQDALKHAYEVQQQIFKALDSAAQNNPKVTGPGATGFAALHKTWYQRFFAAFNDNLQTFYQAKVDKEITNWTGGSQAYGLYKSLQRNKIVSGRFLPRSCSPVSIRESFCITNDRNRRRPKRQVE